MRVVTLARKPLSEATVASNALGHGTAALATGSCRVGGRHPTNLVLVHRPRCECVGTKKVASSAPGARNTALGIMNDDGWQPSPTEDRRPWLDSDGRETIPAWACDPACPVDALDGYSGGASRFFKQAQ
jgi:hypothetical protein